MAKLKAKNPLISVIIPVYNMEKYVAQSVNSVRTQNYKNLEIIIVNDGSTDDSLQIMQNFARQDKRIRIINKNNGGLASAYNAGQRAAQGKYLYFLDSDDWLEPDCLGIMLDIAEKSGAEVIKSFGFIREQNGTSFEFITIPPQKCDKLITNTLFVPEMVSRHVAQWTCLYKRDFLLEHNIWAPEFPKKMAPDMDFMFQVWCCCKKLYIIRKLFVHYRMDNENSDKNSGAKMSFYLIRGHLAARASMVKLFVPRDYWFIKTRTEFEHFIYEFITHRCATNRLEFLKAVSLIFKENIRHKLVDLSTYSLKHRIIYKTIAYFPKLYYLNDVLKIYTETLNRRTGAITLYLLGGIYKQTDEKNMRKIYLFGRLIKKYKPQKKEIYAYTK